MMRFASYHLCVVSDRVAALDDVNGPLSIVCPFVFASPLLADQTDRQHCTARHTADGCTGRERIKCSGVQSEM